MEAHIKAYCNVCILGLFIILMLIIFYIMSGNNIKFNRL